jgi:hypothetical protein
MVHGNQHSPPALSDDSWADRNWEKQTYQHYNVMPYWA